MDTARYDHAAALADLRRRYRRAREYADQAQAAGDRRLLKKALLKLYQRALQIEHAESAPEDWECPQCRFGDENWPGLYLTIWTLHNCVPHWEDIAEEQARVLLAAQVEEFT